MSYYLANMPVPALNGVAEPSQQSAKVDASIAHDVSTNGINGLVEPTLKYANDIVKETYAFAGGRKGRKFRVVCVGASLTLSSFRARS